VSDTAIPTGPDSRLVVREREGAGGRRQVTLLPQYQDRGGAWRLKQSGLMLAPAVARVLAPALIAVAAAIDGSPTDPSPTTEDRDESRYP